MMLSQRTSTALCSRPRASRPVALSVRAQATPLGPLHATATATTSYVETALNGNGASTSGMQPINVNVSTPAPVPQLFTPAENYANLAKVGAKKAEMDAAKIFVSGILAGMYIGVGGFLMCAVTGGMASLAPTLPGLVKLVGGLIFPVGLTLVVLSGTELYTGNTAVIPMSVYEGQASLGGLLKNWWWSWLGNLVGSLVMVAAVAATGILAGNMVPTNLATMKASLPMATVLIRSTVCNWLVCMAVWQAASATTLPGKILGLWFPIMTFVAIGLEHSVANMFFIPMGMAMGAKITIAEAFLNNILPVTLGNTLGGFLFVGTAFSFLYGSLGKPKAPTPAVAH